MSIPGLSVTLLAFSKIRFFTVSESIELELILKVPGRDCYHRGSSTGMSGPGAMHP